MRISNRIIIDLCQIIFGLKHLKKIQVVKLYQKFLKPIQSIQEIEIIKESNTRQFHKIIGITRTKITPKIKLRLWNYKQIQ